MHNGLRYSNSSSRFGSIFAICSLINNRELLPWLQILFNLIFLALTYGMSGLPVEYFRFGLYAAVGLIVSFVAEGMGLAIGATFSITVSLHKFTIFQMFDYNQLINFFLFRRRMAVCLGLC